MQIYAIRIWKGMPFEEYLALPGKSFSGIKSNYTKGRVTEVTDKMRFGSLVDTYLFEPHLYTGEMYSEVRAVARAAQQQFGDALYHGDRQLAVSCVMQHRGFKMLYKGRVDLHIGKTNGVVVDFKASDMDLVAAINFMGYDKQVNGYAIPLQARTSIILSVSPKPPHRQQMRVVPNSLDFWEWAVLNHGEQC